MFQQTLIEISSETRGRRRWTVVLSYTLEALAVIVALGFPLVHTEALPLEAHPSMHPPTRYVPAHVEIVTTPATLARAAHPVAFNAPRPPARIPSTIDRTPDLPDPVNPGMASDSSPDGAISTSDPREQNQVLQSLLRPPATIALHHPMLVPRASRAQESLLIRQIKPAYPPLAVQARIEGSVLIQAVIARDGTIQHLEVLNGHPLLVRAAVDAVRQWQYRPFLLDGEPVEVETQITVNFSLNGH